MRLAEIAVYIRVAQYGFPWPFGEFPVGVTREFSSEGSGNTALDERPSYVNWSDSRICPVNSRTVAQFTAETGSHLTAHTTKPPKHLAT